MKKWMYLAAVAVCVTGCSSMETRNGRNNMLVDDISIEPKPMQAEIQVGPKISGVAECEKWFWFWTKQPAKQTYGTSLQMPDGNFSTGPCTRGAIYDALTKNNADMIVAPKYTAVQKGELCVLGKCMHRVNQIIVTGYKGNIKDISPMQESVVIERQKQGGNKKEATSAPVAGKQKQNIVKKVLLLPVTMVGEMFSVIGG